MPSLATTQTPVNCERLDVAILDTKCSMGRWPFARDAGLNWHSFGVLIEQKHIYRSDTALAKARGDNPRHERGEGRRWGSLNVF